MSGLLQFLAGRPTDLCHKTTTTSPECCCTSGVKSTEVHPHHPSTLLSSLHWLPIAARISFKSLVLAFQAARGTAPPYLQTLITPYTPARPLRSTTSGKLTVPSLRAPGSRSSQSHLFSVLTPRWWNDLPQLVRTAESLAIYHKTQNPPFQTPLPLNSVHLVNCHHHCLLAQYFLYMYPSTPHKQK
ncbi:hypothetical protein AAFF_G00216810 [Aldrovandia affinis]|uniref:Uncharacterized protein n=1 Tax=Aldrovandia affinis TaxID=143900 RepID=A0AAD7W4Y4_9TELE|nr:hypothetical protein AAFF_G00216810 [Aldrovandia affinis]